VDALFAPSDATQKLLERIDMGGRVALSQEHCELDDEIKQLRDNGRFHLASVLQ
jgi:hypothetical protein